MTELYTKTQHNNRLLPGIVARPAFVLALLMAIMCCRPAAHAFDLSVYAEKSKLASGTWVKVAVTGGGMHCIPESTLRSWGFSDPSKVKVYGYGARRLPEQLNETYADDLPQTPSEAVAGKGIYFYAEGPVTWTLQTYEYYRPAQNPFTTTGYYFLSDSDSAPRLVPEKSGFPNTTETAATMFYDRVFHEVEKVSPGEAGHQLLGEDFRYTPTQNFSFSLPDLVEGEPTRLLVSFMGLSRTGASSLTFTANGQTLPTAVTDNIPRSDDKYRHAVEAVVKKEIDLTGNSLNLGITFKTNATVSLANLNYISVNYPRRLRLPSSKRLTFYLTSDSRDRYGRLSGASSSTRIWDVTQPLAITRVDAAVNGGEAVWESSYAGSARTYVAWEPDGEFPAPTYVENVSNQNLHGKSTPEMVIFTPGEWRAQAERLAKFHREDPNGKLDVLVLTPQQIYNEFSSGVPDAQAFRKLLKMFYDRGNAGDGKKLRYAMFFSRPTYDNRRLTQKVQSLGGYPMLPAWFTDRGLHDNDSYTSDDIFSFLEDGSGATTSRDVLCIAVGRIPATSPTEAKNAVDKILNYVNRSPRGIWKNTFILTADDGDNAQHMKQAEALAGWIEGNSPDADGFIKKVYIDEYELVGGKYPEARSKFYRYLDEGALWWSFQGHADPASLTAEGLVTYTDLNQLYLKHWPVVYAATCDFMRWDSSVTSGAEILFKNPSGGVIAAISAVRPVYITENGILSEAFGRQVLSRDENGMINTIGEIYRRAKNDYRDKQGDITPNDNKLRYVLLGDPAMRMAMPSYKVVLDEIAGKPVEPVETAEEPAQLMARQQTTVSGRIVDVSGTQLSDFNGVVSLTLYDAQFSTTTLGHSEGDKEGKPLTFDQQGGRLFVGNATVKGGAFTVKVVMPAEVADNYRPAAFNMYAYAEDGREASGICRDFYVYGTDPDALPDTEAPVIESIYLNHPSFSNGQEVNPSPMLIATVTDDRAMNMSSAGVGHQMAAYLDGGDKTYDDVSDYFTPFSDGTPGGSIAYPIENLAPGNHSLRLRVWDTGPNSTEATIEFVVSKSIAPTLYDVYTDVNPVSTQANFYISHDRPDRNLTVTIEVFDLMGRPLWQATETGRSDMFTSMPITWDLLDSGGRRVPRGIYLYRATISDDDSGEKTSTASRKLAVRGLN